MGGQAYNALRFANLRACSGKRSTGYQVCIAAAGRTFWFNGLTDRALRRALRFRNELYEELELGPRQAFLPRLGVMPARSNVERLGIWFGSDGDLHCRVRDLETGRRVVMRLPPRRYKSNASALRRAEQLVRANLREYNRIVDAYNALRLRLVLASARRELRTLEPELQGLYGFAPDLWQRARRACHV